MVVDNPDGLSPEAWKDRHWQEPLGLEHSRWGSNGDLQCGTSSVISCRDLARTALLWANDGQWPGSGQLVSVEHVREGRELGPEGAGERLTGADYGSTVWLSSDDPVDPEMALWGGLFGQCAIASARHNAVVVSMGLDIFGEGCGGVWAHTRDAIVSDKSALPASPGGRASPEAKLPLSTPNREELLQLREAVEGGTFFPLSRNQTGTVNGLLRGFGEEPLSPSPVAV